jgi:hypothetical protein
MGTTDLEAKLVTLVGLKIVLQDSFTFLTRPGKKEFVEQLIWCVQHGLSSLGVSERLVKLYHRPITLDEIECCLLALNPSAPRVVASTGSTGV